jgi:DeoR/GlpR family transcriptional regulator of sugar metabolism
VPDQHAEERTAHLLDLLSRQQFASIDDMQRATGASAPTIRRDLAALEKRGLVRRVRGGASLTTSSSTLDEAFELRRKRNAREKGAIALAASKLVDPPSSLLLNDGSTTLALAEELVSQAKPLWVATSALNLGERLASVSAIEVVVIGGALRASSFGTSGPLATAALSQITVDTTFLGCDGIDLELGPRYNSLLDAEVAAAMARQGRRVVVLADGNKVGQRSRAGSIEWSDVDVLVTNQVGPEWQERLRAADVEVIQV